LPARLPDPDRAPLARSPLSLVVCQIRYERAAVVGDAHVARDFHARLGGREGAYPRLDSATGIGFQVAVAPGVEPAVTQSQPLSGWRLTSQAGDWVVSLMPEFVSVETSSYDTWENFHERLRLILDATAELISPVFEQRLGLRYVNEMTEDDITEPEGWRRWIRPELIGPLMHENLAPGVTATRQTTLIDLGNEVTCTMNHGFVPDQARNGNPLPFLLDYDISHQLNREFNAAAALETADLFNTDALGLFQVCVLPEYLDHCNEA